MSGGRRLALLAVLSAPLVVTALVLASHDSEDEAGQVPGSSAMRGARAPSLPGVRARTAERVARAEGRHEAEAARREDAHGEPGPTPQTLRVYERTRAAAERVAGRFFAAFSLYEVGLADEKVRRELRATATPAFAEELLAAPPRLPPGASKPERAFLGRVEFVPGDPGASGRPLTSGELVGVVRRGAAAEPIAIELRRLGRGWRVPGLGR